MQVWYIRLFGTLRVSRDEGEFFRFSTRKTGGLLAYLAFYRERRHSREALCEMLWPEEDPQKSRARLRVALTSLRHQLEPPGVPPGSVVRTDGHDQVQLSVETVATDVGEIEAALRTLDIAPRQEERLAAAQRIGALFQPPLLDGFYDDWVIAERERLSRAAVERFITFAQQLPPDTALELVRHAARIDPLAEEPLFYLLPLLVESGQVSMARRTLQTFQRQWEEAMGQPLSRQMRELAAALFEKQSPPAPATSTKKSAKEPSTPPAATAPAPSPAPPARLPTYLTRFFGRSRETETIREALAEVRLVTLTGPGGVGKTRLAVETARGWPGGHWFVPLANVGEPEQFPAALCDALKDITAIRSAPDSPEALLARAAKALAEAPEPLLVLDNLEQIADRVGSFVLALLEQVPTLRLLVTSRLRLHLPGEQEVPLPPLPVPSQEEAESDRVENLKDLTEIASVALFLDRSRTARPDFQITARNRTDILAICRMLEGIPLAIELVAARVGTLVPARMREKLLAQDPTLISDRRATSVERHRSLYAAMEWSYRLLPADLARLFAALSVFRGGFTVEAVAAVGGVAEETAGEALARLRAHSLVGSVADVSDIRYSLLESLRVFAAEQLPSEDQALTARRHADWFAALAEQADAGLSSPEQASWLQRFEADMENLRAAFRSTLRDAPAQALQMAGALWMFWHLRGRPTEGRAWLEQALQATPSDRDETDTTATFQRARALHGAGTLAWVQGDGSAAEPLFHESLRLRRHLGDRAAIAGTLNNLGLLAWSRQELDEARRYHAESLAIRRELGAPAAIASSLQNLAVVDWDRGDYASAQPSYEEALALSRASGDRVGEGHALNNLGNIALSLGDFATAGRWYTESLALKREIGYAPGIAATLSNLGVTALYQGKYTEAERYLAEAVALYREMDAPDAVATQLRNLGQIATERGEWDHAYRLLSESLTLRLESDTPTEITLSLEGFAQWHMARGNADRAACLLGAAAARRAESRTPLYPAERVSLDRTADAARSSLGDERFEKRFHEGEGMPHADIVAFALTQ
jgi:predicted ATPase/DNA-binding SARP family transcriptional activator